MGHGALGRQCVGRVSRLEAPAVIGHGAWGRQCVAEVPSVVAPAVMGHLIQAPIQKWGKYYFISASSPSPPSPLTIPA